MKRKIDTSRGTEVIRTDIVEADDTCLLGANPKFIEAQEARGQSQLVASQQLPADGLISHAGEGPTVVRRILEKAGGRILRQTPSDPIMVDVELPPGWKLQPTDHAMWSKLCDEQGRHRCSVFYKAAFYDRRATISADRRLSANSDCVDYDDSPQLFHGVIRAGNVALWRGALVPGWTEAERKKIYDKARERGLTFPDDASERCRKVAEELLLKHFPLANDCQAYWDLSDAEIQAKLPPSESQVPVGPSYTIGVTLYRRSDPERAPRLGKMARYVSVSDDGFGDAYMMMTGKAAPRFEVELREPRYKTKVFETEGAATAWLAKSNRLFTHYARVHITVSLADKLIAETTWDHA